MNLMLKDQLQGSLLLFLFNGLISSEGMATCSGKNIGINGGKSISYREVAVPPPRDYKSIITGISNQRLQLKEEMEFHFKDP